MVVLRNLAAPIGIRDRSGAPPRHDSQHSATERRLAPRRHAAQARPVAHDESPLLVTHDEVKRRIGEQHRSRRRRWAWTLGLVTAAIIGASLAARGRTPTARPSWRTEVADLGDLELRVVATGSLHARSVVAISAEKSGRVATVEVDVNDPVRRGAVLARLDAEDAEQDVAEARARLRSARADAARARASQRRSRADHRRAGLLAERGLLSDEEEERSTTGDDQASADLRRASAQVALAELQVERAEHDLAKRVIVSPIDGIVLTRSIEAGSIVAATLAAPELFTIAADPKAMELSVPINEADIGRVRPTQAATFSVDAWPDRSFDAAIRRIAWSPTIEETVVTYDATLDVDNPDWVLRPGMTASVTIVADRRVGVLRVPIAALRFTMPDTDEGNPLLPTPFGDTGHRRPSSVWVLRDDEPERVRVTVGANDGAYVEITGGDLVVGAAVIVGEDAKGMADA
jgi:HlyD family secretion protein